MNVSHLSRSWPVYSTFVNLLYSDPVRFWLYQAAFLGMVPVENDVVDLPFDPDILY